MNHDGHRVLQADLLGKALAVLEADCGVLGIVKSGSLARGCADAFSDLDVTCILRDEARSSRERLYEAIGRIGPLLCSMWLFDRNALYLYEDGVRLDLDFLRPSDFAGESGTWVDVVVEHDPEGAIARELEKPRTPPVAPHPKWFEPGEQAIVNWFFWMFRQIVCWARRGAQGDHRSFDKLTSAMGSLAEVRMRLVETRLWTLGTQDYLARADPAFAERMARTHPHLDPAEIVGCARLLLDEYEYVFPPYCRKSGAAYPETKVRVMRRLIEEFDSVES